MISPVYLLVAIVIMVLLLLGGFWISFAIGTGGIISLYFVLKEATLMMYGLMGWDTGTSYVLMALPLFIFVGEFIAATGLTHYLYSGASKITKGIPGGLIQTNVFACAVFAACIGSSSASAATMGRVAYEEQVKKRGYHPGLVLGSIAGGGTLGILIPPSIFFIIYGSIADQSIGKLFIGGIIPGIVITIMFMIYVGIFSFLKPERFEKQSDDIKLTHRISGFIDLWPFILLIILVLGAIYGGIATPTEGAGVGAFIVILMSIFWRRFTWKRLFKASLNSVRTNSMIFLIMINAKVLSVALGYYGIADFLEEYAKLIEHPATLIAVISVIYLILGTFFDDFSILILMLPFILPMVKAAGFDLVWFGVYVCILLEAGLLSPPVGMNLFVLQGVTGAPFSQIVWGSIPFFFILLLGNVIIFLMPELVLWLPGVMK